MTDIPAPTLALSTTHLPRESLHPKGTQTRVVKDQTIAAQGAALTVVWAQHLANGGTWTQLCASRLSRWHSPHGTLGGFAAIHGA